MTPDQAPRFPARPPDRPPLQNRVLPTGTIVADPARGLFTGNRGILHDAGRGLGTARWRHPHWIVCALSHPRGIRRRVMSPGTWTELFFLDEAVALAAGHRPCAYCRRPAFLAFQTAWIAAGLPGRTAPEIDRTLHAARVARSRAQITHKAEIATLPDGTFIAVANAPALLCGDRLLPYVPKGYGPPLPRQSCGQVTVLTPAPTVATLIAGYRPELHGSAHP
jgi:hypothetical protein